MFTLGAWLTECWCARWHSAGMMQLFANALIAGSLVLLMGMGFGLIYNCVRFFHFAHAAIFTVSGYAVYLLVGRLRCPSILAVPLAVAIGAGLGVVIELVVYRLLRKNNASAAVMLIASLGLYIVIENLCALLFGPGMLTLGAMSVGRGLPVLGARVTALQLRLVVFALLAAAAVALLLRCTQLGLRIRAVSSSLLLARASGMRTDIVYVAVFAIGSALASVAGVFSAFEVGLTPTMGFYAMLLAAAAVVVAGTRQLGALSVAAMMIGGIQACAVRFFGAQWQEPITFGILVFGLLVRGTKGGI